MNKRQALETELFSLQRQMKVLDDMLMDLKQEMIRLAARLEKMAQIHE